MAKKKKESGGLLEKKANAAKLTPIAKLKKSGKRSESEKKKRSSAEATSEAEAPTAKAQSEDERVEKRKRKKKAKSMDSMDPPKEAQLETQLWYFGAVPREEIADRLKKDGDFLVRLTLGHNQENVIVLSVMNKDKNVLHFPIIRDPYGFRLDGEEDAFDCVHGLVKYYIKKEQPLTKGTKILIRKAVARPEWFYRATDIKEKGMLDMGRYGDVYKCSVKIGAKNVEGIIKKSKVSASDEERRAVVQEAKILRELQHEHVVKCIGLSADKFPIGMILEPAEQGSLEKYLNTHRGTITIAQKLRMLCEVGKALEKLEAKNVIHRDIRAANCMVGKAPAAGVKLGEFGQAKRGPSFKETSEKVVGVRWSAPETLEQGLYTLRTDTFSYGVLAWEVFHEGDNPWTGCGDADVRLNILQGQRLGFTAPDIPEKAKELVQSFWYAMPTARPAATALVISFTAIAKEYTQNANLYVQGGVLDELK